MDIFEAAQSMGLEEYGGQKIKSREEMYKEDIIGRMKRGEAISDEEKKLVGAYISEKSKINTQTKKALESLTVYKTQKEELEAIERNRDAINLNQVDIEFLIERVKETLPEKAEEEPAWWEGKWWEGMFGRK